MSNDQLADQLQELHAAFAEKLAKDMALHKAKCAEQDAELRIREKVAAEKMQVALELAEALKERQRVIEKKEKEHAEKHAAVRVRFAALVCEMDQAAAARAKPARIGS